MKNKIFIVAIALALCTVSASVKAQSSWTSGTNKLYTNPSATCVGIGTSFPTDKLNVVNGHIRIGDALAYPLQNYDLRLKFGYAEAIQLGVWENNNTLSFKADKFSFNTGNVGIGVSNPQYKLDVDGKVFLRTCEWRGDRGAYSYLQWQAHTLVMGVPAGTAAVTRLYLTSGGSSDYDHLYSEFKMFTAYSDGSQVAKIKLNTEENCWINTPGYIGIGTETPQNKLDVRGAIRADEIYVNVASGADFVFDESYKLRPLSEVKEYVEKNQHLPEIPSAEEMQQKGVNMNDLQMQLLQKVEELTLYILQQEQRIQQLETQIKR